MTTLNESVYTGAAIVSEANGYRSREIVTVLSGQNLLANSIVGRVMVAGATAAAKPGGNTGNGTMGAITVSQGAKLGRYTLRITEPATDAGTFEIEDSDGVMVGTGTVGVAFSGGGLAFTLADGSTDFVAGDGFDLTVATGSGKARAIDFSSAVGADKAVGMLYASVDASAGDVAGVILARDCELNEQELVWPTGTTTDQKTAAKAQLADVGIIVRPGLPA